MRWLWSRRDHRNGQAAAAAKQDADRQKQDADDRSVQVDRTIAEANAVIRRSNRFAAEVERSLRMRRGHA